MAHRSREKCVLQPLSRATGVTRRIPQNKNLCKISRASGHFRPGSTAGPIWLAEGEELGSNLLHVAYRAGKYPCREKGAPSKVPRLCGTYMATGHPHTSQGTNISDSLGLIGCAAEACFGVATA